MTKADNGTPETFSDALRRCVIESGIPVTRLAIMAQITPMMLWRFMKQGTGLTTTTLDKLYAVLDLELRPRTAEAKTAKKPKPTKTTAAGRPKRRPGRRTLS
jgi:hypothetical protein